MTPSPEHSPRRLVARPRRGWRYPLVATAVSAALMLSPLATQAFADDQLPGADPASPTATVDPSTSTGPSTDSSPDPSTDPSPDPSTDPGTSEDPADGPSASSEGDGQPGDAPRGDTASPSASSIGRPAGAASTSQVAAPSTPGVPSDPTPLFTEDFQNRTHGSNVLLTGYTGAGGQTYTGDANWVSRSQCNGFIIDSDSTPQAADCGGSAPLFNSLRQLIYGLGVVDGQTDPKQNAGVAAFTAGNPGGNLVEFETSTPLSLASAGRFVTFSVDAVATSCTSSHPKLRFYLMDGTIERPVSTSAIDPCTGGANVVVPASSGLGAITLKGGRFSANGSVLLASNAFGIRLRNENASGAGNDGAFDKIRVLDATPQLDKAFSPQTVPAGGISTLTFTVTNTSDLAAKSGWGFTDTLPAGLTVAAPLAKGGTCAATVTGSGSSIVVSGGVLPAQTASCTVTVAVTSSAPAVGQAPVTYENCAANLSGVLGLELPGCASVTFATADRGDAPGSYGTTSAQNGPAHALAGYDAASHTTQLMLGSTVDADSDGVPSAGADGDDSTGTDDEDGLTALTLTPGATAATAEVAVTNSTGNAATLHGWIDTNGNGTFQASEATTTNVPAGATSATLNWTGLPAAGSATKPVLRLRLTSATLADNATTGALDERSQGGAPDGDVEDHPVQVTPPLTSCTATQVRATQRYWFFGNAAGLDFGPSFDTPQKVTGVGTTPEGSTVVTDTSGNLQFWSNADTIYNRNGQPMLNGTGLTGSFSATQTVSAFPAPGRPGFYFVVTTSSNHTAGQLRYSEVDMSLDGGLGGVVTGRKNLNLGAATAFEDIQAVPNADGTGYWVITSTAGTGNVLAYAFDGNGPVTGTAVVTPLPNVLAGTAGYHRIQVSPDGSQLLLMSGDVAVDRMWLLDFDGATGRMYPRVMWTGGGTGNRAYGADFSPSGKYVYVSYIDGGQLLRWDISSYTTQAQLEAHAELVIDGSGSSGQVRRSPDGRMIWVNDDSISSLTVLQTPDDPAGAGLVAAGISIAPATTTFGLPEFVTGCPAPNFLDYGDAPASYGTLVAADGPRHSIAGFDGSAHTSSLMLGTHVDDELNGVPTAGADGDDTADTADEDGVPAAITQSNGATTPVQVTVTNSSTTPATLAGWIDGNANGVFDAAERVTATVPAGSGTATYSLTFPAATLNTDTSARFRVFSGAVANPLPTGAAAGGEVEDYTVTPGAPVVTCATDPAIFNTAYNGSGGSLPVGSRDTRWQSGIGNATGPASVTSWIPAYVVARVGSWAASPYGDADWISHYANANQGASNVDDYFRYRFTIDPNVDLSSFSLPMDFYVDNSVQEVWVNGTPQSGPGTGLPQSTNTYLYVGYIAANRARTVLSNGFKHGANTIVVRVASGSPSVGFMAQLSPTPLCADRGDAPDSFGTTTSVGASHGEPGYDAVNHTAPLMLGAHVDTEPNGVPTPGADGDDNSGLDDEDAGTVQLTTGATTAAVTVPVTNSTGTSANLYGWIDANGNGTFQASEAATAVVASGDTDATLSWSGLTAIGSTPPVVRLRLTTTTLTDTPGTATLDERSQGGASDGEVEDSVATIVPPAVCDGSAYPVVAANNVSDLFRVSPDGTTISHVADIAYDLNAIGYNQADGFLYGWRRATASSPFNQLARINPTTGSVALLGTVPGTPASGWVALAAMNGNVMYLNAGNSLYTVDVSTKTITSTKAVVGGWPSPTPADIAFNPLDGLLYGYVPVSATTGRVVKIDPATGVTTSTDFTQPAAANSSWGGQWMDGSGRLYGLSNTDQTLWRIDGVGTATPTIAKVVQGSGVSAGGDAASCTPPDLLKDVSPGTVVPGGTVTYTYTVSNPTLATLSGVGVLDVLPNDSAGRTFTGLVTVSGGGLPVINWNYTLGNTNRPNDTLTLTGLSIPRGGRAVVTVQAKVSPTAASATVINQAELTGLPGGFAKTLSDYPSTGAIDDPTPLVIQAFDRGDAPASFTTTQAQNGPSHSLVGYDATAHTSSLMLGALVDDDADGVPGATADGDDTAGVDDEDALTSLSIAPGATTATATVPVVNTTGAAATLYGFIDTNGNGTYQTSEAATVNVPNGATSGTLSWAGLPPAVDGSQPVVRLRLTSATLTDNTVTLNFDDRSQGPAPDGEVEDSLATVAAVLPNDCSNPLIETFGAGAGRASLPAGQTTYLYAATGAVNDGSYALVPGVDTTYGSWWHTGADHTPGDTNGRAMLVNADFVAGKFFSKSFTGLQVGSKYDFSAWITNANNAGSAILPNVKFQVIDPATGTVLATFDTGNLPNQASLVWTRYALSFTALQSTVRLELVNNAPGGGGNDLALDDVGIGPVCEYGDAPNSYGTLLASGGPVHAKGAPHLGAGVDYEGDGQPTAAADGDDTTGTPDDEDGVTFNPALGYPNPTIRTGTDPVTLAAPVNHVTVDASAAGFASAWVDWNQDGDFADAGEQVADAKPVTAGNNDLSFSNATNPNDIRTFVRVRYSTDAASIHAPTGAAPDGEVEDYQVLVERLVIPATCNPIADPYYALTATSITDHLNVNLVNETARYPGVTVVKGVAVDMLAAVTAGRLGSTGFSLNGDDPSWILAGTIASVRLSFVVAGTTTPVSVNTALLVNDMDRLEVAAFKKVELEGSAIPAGSKVVVTQDTDRYLFSGTVTTNPTDPRARFQVWFKNKSVLNTDWRGSGFSVDGNGNLPPSCDDYGDAPDSYKTLFDSDGAHHRVDDNLRLGSKVEIDGEGQPTAAADGDDTDLIDDEDGLSTPITQTAGQTTTVAVSVTNSAAAAATLAGWIDLNNNGTFETGERQTIAVPASSGTSTYPLVFPQPTAGGNSYARFRLFPGVVANPLPTGPATAGEVEDYPTTFVQGPPVLGSCENVFTFDSNNAGWRVATVKGADGKTVVLAPAPVGWAANAGNPGGGLINDDLDSNFTEVWTPPLVASGYATDYSSYLGKRISFDYKNNTGIGYNVYLGVVGTNGQVYWFSFRPQIVNSKAWNRVRVPLDPSKWLTGWSGTTGPLTTSPAPTQAEFLAALGSVERFTISIEGRNGTDRTQIDNFGQACDDFGDAPSSYGTDIGGEQASHRPDAVGPALRLGATVDVEDAPAPSAGADGDDTTGTDDENGVGPITVTTGAAPSVPVTVTNATAGPATLAGWVDLDKSGTFDANERAVGTVAAGTAGGTVTLTFTGNVTTTQSTYARFRIYPGIVANPLAIGPVEGGEVEDHPVTTAVPALSVTKTSDATASSKPGDVVHYTVKMTNTGSGAFTVANPARMFDDLTDVLDDATYNNDAAADVGATPTYAAPRISWSGPLAAGQTVTVTYSVTLKGGGDGHVRNVAFAPPGTGTNPPTPDCTTPGGVPCAQVETLLPKLSITKTANRTALPAVGQTIVYTVTVENTGPGDFTAAHLATFSDDLSAVLDDATMNVATITASRGTATFTSPNLAWSGTLPAGQSATITYTLTYTGAGDHQLDNSACVPVSEALDPADTCRTVSVPGSGLRHDKSVDPASGTAVQVGQVLTYTLTFENVGPVPATVDSSDDLSDVLDDAQLVGAPIAGAGLTATVNGTQLDVTGSVPAGATRTVTYQVQVRPWAAQGDHVLANALGCEPGEPAGCAPEETTNPVRHVTLTKTSNATVNSKPGDVVTYTVTATNDGTGDWTATDPTTILDDLTGVLDDATYNADATASSGADPTYAAPRITWTGALAHGDSVTITYTVVLKGGGDGQVDNVAWQPGPGGPGPTPDCATTPLVCTTHGSDLPKLTIKKTSNRAQLPAAGQKITYTVTVTNPGPGDYTAAHPATFSDDLTDVLDDATFDAGSITVSTGAAALNGSSLDWSGVLTAGQSATVTYTLTYQASGNLVVDNHACIPVSEAKDPADACRTVHTPGSGLRHFKSVDPANGTSVSEGQVLTYTLIFENVGPAAATVNTFDDLSDVADDAVLDTASITADAGLVATPNAAGDRIDITGTVPTGGTLTVTYQVTVKAYADQGDHVVTNALACEPGDPQPCDPTSTSNPVRHLTLTKTSDATVDSKPGDTVSYTVRLVNDGAGDYTALDPASLVDDLTGVLDDATFNGVAHSSTGPDPTYLAPRITWVGPLAAGDEVRVTYEVVLKGGGDGHVRNVAWQPVDPGTPGPTPDCATSPRPCDTETFDLPKLVISKAANRTQLTATGQTVTYTVVVTNPGPGDYTAAHLASFSDDLSDVVDDAVIDPASVTATSGTATYSGALLVWTGALPANGSATITYTATYRATGNHVLANTACVPVDETQTPASQCDGPPPIAGAQLTHAKSVAPTSGTPVQVGQTLTYTLTFTNSGTVPADVDTTDDLSGVLDDAALVAGSINAGAGLAAVLTGSDLDVTGTVPAGATRTVTYQVTVKPYAAQGDHVLANALACEPGDPTPCDAETTSNPVAHLAVDKSSNRTADSKPGDTITYTVTALNDGPGDFPVGAPATVVDDLTGVLDDATYGNDAVAKIGATTVAAPTYAAPRVTWSGALGHGETVTITYTVVLKGGGDGVVRNVAWAPAGVPGPTPDCATSPLPCVTETFDLPKLVVAKSSSRVDLPATGQNLTYTVVVTNPGPGDYTAAHPATFSDDLSDVLDDATIVGTPTATVGAASVTGTTLSWSGVLAAGGSSTITYTFTYRATGDHVLDNTACVPATESQDPAAACDTVSVPGSGLVHHKSVSPASGTAVEVGDVLTYTLTFDNTVGATAATVNTSDDLSAVLDDATLVAGSITAGAGLSANLAASNLAVTGTVPAGATRTVTYQVTVKPYRRAGRPRHHQRAGL